MESLVTCGIDIRFLRQGYPFKTSDTMLPYKIDVAINGKAFIEIKYLRRAEYEESPAKNQSWGGILERHTENQ